MIRSSLFALVIAMVLAACGAEQTPTLRDAWVRAVPAERTMTAAYLSIDNPTDTTMVVTGAHTSGFARTEMHTTIEEDGVSRMRALGTVDVAAGTTTTMAPGGMHLMLMGAETPIVEGETVVIELDTEAHGVLTINATIMSRAPDVD